MKQDPSLREGRGKLNLRVVTIKHGFQPARGAFPCSCTSFRRKRKKWLDFMNCHISLSIPPLLQEECWSPGFIFPGKQHEQGCWNATSLIGRRLLCSLIANYFPGTVAESCSWTWTEGRQIAGDLLSGQRGVFLPLSPMPDLKCYNQYVVTAWVQDVHKRAVEDEESLGGGAG